MRKQSRVVPGRHRLAWSSRRLSITKLCPDIPPVPSPLCMSHLVLSPPSTTISQFLFNRSGGQTSTSPLQARKLQSTVHLSPAPPSSVRYTTLEIPPCSDLPNGSDHEDLITHCLNGEDPRIQRRGSMHPRSLPSHRAKFGIARTASGEEGGSTGVSGEAARHPRMMQDTFLNLRRRRTRSPKAYLRT